MELFLDAYTLDCPAHDRVRYLIFQHERATRDHIQGYVEFNAPTRLNAVKTIFGCPKMHLETRRGSRDQARNYCQKEEGRVQGPWEWGNWERGGSGKRNDLSEVAELARNGTGILEIAEKFPATFIRNHRGIRELKFLFDQEKSRVRNREISVVVITGPTGVGKTHLVFDYCSRNNIPLFKLDEGAGGTLWYDGYSGESALLLDDYYGWIPYGNFLKVLDKYPFRCPIKGGHVWAAWEFIFITSNKPPEQWYKKGFPDALKRRITCWYVMDEQHQLHLGNSAMFSEEDTQIEFVFD